MKTEDTRRGSMATGDDVDNPRIPGLDTGNAQKPVAPEEAQNESMGRSEDHTSLEDRGTLDDEDVDRMRPAKS